MDAEKQTVDALEVTNCLYMSQTDDVVRHCLFLYFGWNGMKHFKCGRTQIFHHTHAHTGGGEMTPLTLVSQPATLNNPVRMYSLAIRRF